MSYPVRVVEIFLCKSLLPHLPLSCRGRVEISRMKSPAIAFWHLGRAEVVEICSRKSLQPHRCRLGRSGIRYSPFLREGCRVTCSEENVISFSFSRRRRPIRGGSRRHRRRWHCLRRQTWLLGLVRLSSRGALAWILQVVAVEQVPQVAYK